MATNVVSAELFEILSGRRFSFERWDELVSLHHSSMGREHEALCWNGGYQISSEDSNASDTKGQVPVYLPHVVRQYQHPAIDPASTRQYDSHVTLGLDGTHYSGRSFFMPGINLG